jgi:FixJ family two-component response regulator
MSSVTSDPVFIVDDDPASRESVAALVRSHGMEAETFSSAEDFLRRFDRDSSGCIVVDMRMTGMSGLELLEQLRRQGVELPLIMITGYGDVPTAVRAMRGGAMTFLEKPCSDQRLWESIVSALNLESEARTARQQRTEIRRRLATLTPDERKVLAQLLDGNSNKGIAKDLDIGLRTVELRRANILGKMQASSLAELVRMVLSVEETEGNGG